jgi:3-deoxy-D-manno-octulosonic-acid transferase
MQTVADIEYMKSLGVPADLLLNLGNLKYEVLDDSSAPDRSGSTLILNEQTDKRLWVAGSTHPGEEKAILKVYQQLRVLFGDLYLVIAPRNVERGAELAIMASRENLSSVRRSEGGGVTGDLLILDTLGELVSFYRKAAFAFVGGSLVEERGHNPLEPAVFGKPVIFGPHMEDFAEIAEDLLDIGGAVRIEGVDDMALILKEWLTNDEKRLEVGRCGAKLVRTQRGVTERHVELVRKIIDEINY